ncbi:putative membrane protein-like protein [Emericellopsis cladophorae]|uniref:Glycerophosphocholine acyltransferase 1 n=1 Tax=Emericellopsis cladophorae TaxID=2686198 RepID=A0A9Q0BF73_9HYPO|nr:putative membrane protein-like protein [Emericellopsis cladophorae]KAI6783187.1 putative membrane protein-like protein [Emericellopsis cladophorae]
MSRSPESAPASTAANNPGVQPPLENDAVSLLSSSPLDDALLDTPMLGPMTPKSPRLSRNPSFSGSSSYQEDWDTLPPLDRLTVLDLLDNFALPQQLEKLQRNLSAQTDKVRRSKDAFKSKTQVARERLVDEWRQRLPSADEQLDRYRKRMRRRVENLGKQWNDTKAISLREKISFICGVMNIFISGYLIGAYPEYFHIWYTVQLMYFMPIRFFTYRRRGLHYFLADLCYFTNLLVALSLWVFPNSKRLFTSAYCLAFGNNAVAIIMWRNSLVFHSFDKVTSLFIHMMPCATLHCVVHLLDPEWQMERFPAIWAIKNADPGSSTAYANVFSMLAWSTLPYAIWQVCYYFFITVRRREKIAAGRPTSFTWLRRSYSKTLIGKLVLALPDSLQETAFMLIQYAYACLTMVPCPLWFLSRWASAGFLMVIFSWSIYNGSTYYIDVFGKRFQKELESMKQEVLKWQSLADAGLQSPPMGPQTEPATPAAEKSDQLLGLGASAASLNSERQKGSTQQLAEGIDSTTVPNINSAKIPLLDEDIKGPSGVDEGNSDSVHERKSTSARP